MHNKGSEELSRIFKYKLFRVKDERQVKVVVRYAVNLTFDLQEGDKFDRNTLLRKVLAGKKEKTKELVTRDGKKKWRVPDVFRKPGLRKATLITTHENSKRIKFEYFFLTLKMTAAKAVETSVTSTSSLSQDYTNLDDQLPLTCHDSPRFKPFTL